MLLRGCFVALVTPFTDDGKVDTQALIRIIEWHIDQRIDGIVILGTTGESSALSALEQKHIIQTTVTQVHGRVPVVVGTGATSTTAAIQNTLIAQQLGADAALVMTPAYVKPPQRGLFEHYQAIAHASQLPVIIYNIPGRTCCDCLPETIAALSQIDGIVGIKETVSDDNRITTLKQQCGNSFAILSGDDEQTLTMMTEGACGVISVTANIAPGQMHQCCTAMFEGHTQEAESIHQHLMPLHQILFCETNPIPIKWALHKLKATTPHCRLPLVTLARQYRQALEERLTILETL